MDYVKLTGEVTKSVVKPSIGLTEVGRLASGGFISVCFLSSPPHKSYNYVYIAMKFNS